MPRTFRWRSTRHTGRRSCERRVGYSFSTTVLAKVLSVSCRCVVKPSLPLVPSPLQRILM